MENWSFLDRKTSQSQNTNLLLPLEELSGGCQSKLIVDSFGHGSCQTGSNRFSATVEVITF
jgi:hypothetical protein